MSGFVSKILKNSQSGLSLLEVLVGVSILGVAIVGNTQRQANLQKGFRHEKSMYVYATIISDVNKLASNYTVLMSSLKESNDATIKKCLKNRGSNDFDCIGTSSNSVKSNKATIKKCLVKGVKSDFNCIGTSSNGVNIALLDLVTNQRLTGESASNAVYYDINGNLCHGNKNHCIAKAYTEVTPICFDRQTNRCSVAHAFKVKYTVEPHFNQEFWLSLKMMPKSVTFEVVIDSRLTSPIQYVQGTISCSGSRNVLYGLSLAMYPICLPYPPGIVGKDGKDGPPGTSTLAGPPGNEASCYKDHFESPKKRRSLP